MFIRFKLVRDLKEWLTVFVLVNSAAKILVCRVFVLQPGGPKFPPRAYLVDLVHRPGKLLPIDCPEAVNYKKL